MPYLLPTPHSMYEKGGGGRLPLPAAVVPGAAATRVINSSASGVRAGNKRAGGDALKSAAAAAKGRVRLLLLPATAAQLLPPNLTVALCIVAKRHPLLQRG